MKSVYNEVVQKVLATLQSLTSFLNKAFRNHGALVLIPVANPHPVPFATLLFCI